MLNMRKIPTKIITKGVNEVQYRNELKHLITPGDRAAICAVMKAVAQLDPHAQAKGYYTIRSLYFDNLADKALREKLDGVNEREKFRIRYYDGDTSVIHLEKKVKRDNVGYKVSCSLTADEAQRIVDGDILWMATDKRGLVVELYAKMKGQGLRPKTIVDYERIPFVYGPGNVRVTVDYNIRFAPVYPQLRAAEGTGHSMQALNSLSQPHGADLKSLRCTDFLNPDCVTIPASSNDIVLEVKWDDYLPTVIRHAVQLKGRRQSAFSKYAQCRIYG